jgi:hypothetical protein
MIGSSDFAAGSVNDLVPLSSRRPHRPAADPYFVAPPLVIAGSGEIAARLPFAGSVARERAWRSPDEALIDSVSFFEKITQRPGRPNIS